MPRIATPIAPPVCRSADMTAEPIPLRSADSGLIAALIAVGMAKPRPKPKTVNQTATNP